jgi:putative ABC transport system permease protein
MRMNLLRNVRLGIKNLLLHKLRSFLTMLGVVCGVASVVVMLAVGEGASKEALEQIRRLGSTNIMLAAMKPLEEDTSQRVRMSIYGLLYDDETRIRESFASVVRTVPVKEVRRDGRLRERSLELRVVGTTPDWFDLVRRDVIGGRVLLARDLQSVANVVVLTEHGARRLLATEETIGQSVRIGPDPFEVIGIVRSEQSDGTPDQDVDAYIPISVAMARFGDITIRRRAGSMEREMVELHQIIVQVRDESEVEDTAVGIEAMLAAFHRKKDYRVNVPLAQLRQAEAMKRTFNWVLGSIAGIGLLVGGIGIMNIMLASVTERTREIGIRRAIGARKRQIVVQFLIETVVLSVVGGLIGIAAGMAVPSLITYLAEMPTVVTTWSLLLAVGISMLVGIFFGFYPALRAANLDPIVALRHE